MDSFQVEPPRRGGSVYEWGRKVCRALNALRLRGDGRTCRITQTEAGAVLSVILPKEQDAPGGASISALSDKSYRGFFKVVDIGGGKVSVICGSCPEDFYCGFVDLDNGEFGVVYKTTLEVDFTTGNKIYLVATYNDDLRRFATSITKSLPSEGEYGYFTLATVGTKNGKNFVRQIYFGGMIYFSSRYFL